MKISKYTHLFSLDNRLFVVYNCLSGGIVKCPDSLFRALEKLKESGECDWDSLDTAISEKLKESGIIVDTDKDELSSVAHAFHRRKDNSSHLSLTIAPTMDCNFSCFYCYEQNAHVSMSNSVEAQLENFVAARLDSAESFSLSWLGGEPLLEKETVFRLTEGFSQMCRDKDVSPHFSITTNGYLLDEPTADRLVEVGVHTIQVTLDGLKDTHNKRRCLKKSEHGSFDTIVENLRKSGSKFKSLHIRMNVDSYNRNEWKALKDYLSEQGIIPHASFYIAGVDSPNEHNQPNRNHCMTGESFAETYLMFLADAVDCQPYMIKLPSMPVCGAIRENYWSVDPDGYLYKCWNDIGCKDKSVAHVSEPEFFNDHYDRWMAFNPADHEMCRECTILPVCMGKCPDLQMKFGPGSHTCSMLKQNLRETVLLYYLNRKRNEIKEEVKPV